jgi:hypothetical protein
VDVTRSACRNPFEVLGLQKKILGRDRTFEVFKGRMRSEVALQKLSSEEKYAKVFQESLKI